MASSIGFHRLQARPLLVSAAPSRPYSPWHRGRWRGAQHATGPAARQRCVTLAATAGQQPDTGNGFSGASLLQRRLAELGVADWHAYNKPHHAALVGEVEVEQFAAKVAELAREGLTAEDVDRLMFEQQRSPRTCSLEGVFLPNLAYLRSLLADAKNEPKRGEPTGLTPLGRLLRRQPSAMAKFLTRTPERVLELDWWVCGELGVTRGKLAAAVLKYPSILYVSVDAGRSVVAFFEGELGLPREEVKQFLLRQPATFCQIPGTLREKLRKLGNILDVVDESRAGQLMVSTPSLFTNSLNELPAVLSELDALFGREGAGVALVMRQPILATLSLSRFRRSLDGLLKLGFDKGEVLALVESYPSVLLNDLGTALQQQKLAWALAELKWTVQKMFANNLFNHDLRRMASRLAFMRQLGLPDPGSLGYIGMAAEPKFLERLSKRVGREVGKAEFDAFVAGWLLTEQGRKYGFKPDTPPPQRRKRTA